MHSLKKLDSLVRSRVNVYYRELDEGADTVLSEEDALGAAGHADQIYLDHTNWPATKCADRALDIAFEEKDKYMERVLALN
jgi:L-fucose mutarotase/ribose pyranase (RbsD/FucU family)